jgi:hypothetical protein
VIGSSDTEHVGNEFCGYWSSTLVLFVLASIWEARNDGGNTEIMKNFTKINSKNYREADAILHALIMIKSSIKWSFTSPDPL